MLGYLSFYPYSCLTSSYFFAVFKMNVWEGLHGKKIAIEMLMAYCTLKNRVTGL